MKKPTSLHSSDPFSCSEKLLNISLDAKISTSCVEWTILTETSRYSRPNSKMLNGLI